MAQPRIFISYRRKPSAMLATLLARELNARGIDAFVDTRRTDGGGPFPDRLLHAIESADVFVCLLGEDTLASDWVRREIEHAHAQGKILIPVFQESYAPPAGPPEAGGAVHALLQSDGVHVMDVKNIYVDQAIDSLATMIHKSLPRRGPSRGLLAGLSALVLLAAALILLILSNVLNPPPEGSIPDASQAALTLTAAAETRTALAATAATAETVLGGQDPAGTLTAVVLTQTALVEIQNQTRIALGPALTNTPTPTEPPARTLTPTATQAAPVTTGSLSAREAALQRARDFQGSNDDWEPYIETFTFDGGASIDLALVPAGCFRMGNDPDAYEGAADGGEQCFEEPFWIGRYEVTNAQHNACVEAGWCGETSNYGADFNGSEQPLVGVRWLQARDYVEWLSEISGMAFGLPTEAEWEYAARGPDAWAYPWGDNFDGARLNTCDRNCGLEPHDPAIDDGYAVTAPVGSFSPAGDSWVGAADMAGNVWEWTSSLHRDYPYDPADGREDPSVDSGVWIARGGSWDYDHRAARAATRSEAAPPNGDSVLGFRVVYRPSHAFETPADPLPAFTATLTPHEAALQRARDFQGGNDDWEPYVETFTFDNEINIDLALVPAGCFRMGNDSEAREGVDDGGEQCFDEPFWIGRTEITNAQYMQCAEVGTCDGPYDFGADFNAPDQPVVGVDWFMARQYVEWLSEVSGLSFSLPTEAEWEYAARGPDVWLYPWGNDFDGVRLNYCDSSCPFDWRDSAFDDGYETTAPSGNYSPAGDSWVAAADMAGNVWEWTSTIYREYPYDPADGRENPATTSSGLVTRGGSWGYDHRGVRAASRYGISPVNGVDGAGLRVVCRPPSP